MYFPFKMGIFQCYVCLPEGTCLFFLEDTRGQETASQVSVFRCVGVSNFSKREVPWETVKKEMTFYPDTKNKKDVHTHTLLLFLMSLSMYINNHIHNRCPVFYKHISFISMPETAWQILTYLAPLCFHARLNGTWRWRSWFSKTAVTHQRVGHHLQAFQRGSTWSGGLGLDTLHGTKISQKKWKRKLLGFRKTSLGWDIKMLVFVGRVM